MSTKEGMWKLLVNQKKTDKKHWIDSSSQPSEVNYLPCQSFGLLDFRLVKGKRYFLVHAILLFLPYFVIETLANQCSGVVFEVFLDVSNKWFLDVVFEKVDIILLSPKIWKQLLA